MSILLEVRLRVGVALLSAMGVTAPALARQATPPQAAQVTLHLSDGSIVIGEVLSEADGKIRLRNSLFGEVTIELKEVQDRGPLEEEGPEALTAHKAEAAAPPAHTAAPSWTRSITTSTALVSAPFAQGQLSTDNPALTGAALHLPGEQKTFQLGFTMRHTGPRATFSFTGNGLIIDTEPIGRVAEALNLDLEYTRVLSPRTYALSSTTFRRDAASNVFGSLAELAGVGFKAVTNERLKVDFVVGGALVTEQKNTPYDGTLQPQAGVMEAVLWQINPRANVTHRIVYRAGLRDQAVWNLESYSGVQAAITSRFSIVTGLTWNYDNVLGESVTAVPPNELFPGSPALSLKASLKTFRQFTSGIQFTF